MSDTEPTTARARQAYYDRIAPSHLTPLWEVLSALVTPEPQTKAAAAVWHYDEIRPYIHSHAGDVNIVDVSDDGVVKLQMVGTCHGCPMSMLTLRLGIERILMEKVEGLTRIISVRPDEIDFDEIEVDD